MINPIMKFIRTKKTELIQFRVTPEMKEKLKTVAEERNTTIAAIIEDSLIQAIQEPSLEERVRALEDEVKALKGLSRKH